MLSRRNSGDLSEVTQDTVARRVATELANTDSLNEGQTNNHVLMLFTAIGKFVAFMFRKTHYETVIADVFGLGTFIRNCTIGKIGVTQFYPSGTLAAQVNIFKNLPSAMKEPTQRQELLLSKLAQICSLSEEMTSKLLAAIGRSIVSSH